jgi:hypothetical protein
VPFKEISCPDPFQLLFIPYVLQWNLPKVSVYSQQLEKHSLKYKTAKAKDKSKIQDLKRGKVALGHLIINTPQGIWQIPRKKMQFVFQ